MLALCLQSHLMISERLSLSLLLLFLAPSLLVRLLSALLSRAS